ncbi:hypothetical protein PG984_005011 [Apiospora sp. TS-2023a]
MSATTEIFPYSIPQEVLDAIVHYLGFRDMHHLSLACKNLNEGVIPKLYERDGADSRVLQYAARRGRVGTVRRVLKFTRHRPGLVVNRLIRDRAPDYIPDEPEWKPPLTTFLALALAHGHAAVARKLLEAGADGEKEGSAWIVLKTRKPLRPINWVLDHMSKTGDLEKQKPWIHIFVFLLKHGASVYPTNNNDISALGQSIHRNIPLEATRLLIQHGKLGKEHMSKRYMYQLGEFGMQSALTLAYREEHAVSSSGVRIGQKRLAMIQDAMERKGT